MLKGKADGRVIIILLHIGRHVSQYMNERVVRAGDAIANVRDPGNRLKMAYAKMAFLAAPKALGVERLC